MEEYLSQYVDPEILKYAIPAGCAGIGFLTAYIGSLIYRKVTSKKNRKQKANSKKSSKVEEKLTTSEENLGEKVEEEEKEDEITAIPKFYIPRLVSHPIRPLAKDAFDLLKGFYFLY